MTSAPGAFDPGAFDTVQFRAALGRFASGVTVVSTLHDGFDHAMTASAFTSVSLDPPRVLVCVMRTTRFHEAVMASRRWGVSILARDGQDAASWLATKGRPLEHQLDAFPHHRGSVTGAALIDAALAWLECETQAVYDGADHSIVVGQVLSAASRDEADDPLLYYRSHYGSLIRSSASEKTPHVLPPGRETG
ncbi:MAG: flavin reductase family protein [Nocardioidaceae bacterium]